MAGGAALNRAPRAGSEPRFVTGTTVTFTFQNPPGAPRELRASDQSAFGSLRISLEYASG